MHTYNTYEYNTTERTSSYEIYFDIISCNKQTTVALMHRRPLNKNSLTPDTFRPAFSNDFGLIDDGLPQNIFTNSSLTLKPLYHPIK